MSLRFIIGRAGTGKTKQCIKEIHDRIKEYPDGPKLIYLVPEQATYQSDLALASELEMDGFMRADVLSFRRLAFRVLQEVGGIARPHIGELGKDMIIRKFLNKRKDDLKVFSQVLERQGFPKTLSNALSELKAYRHTPIELENFISSNEDNVDSILLDKLKDLQIVYKEVENFLSDSFIDPDDHLNLLAEKIKDWAQIKDSEIWIDGFTGFTPQEYKVIEKLLLSAKNVNIALCFDWTSYKNQNIDDFFYVTEETKEKLVKIASKNNIPVEENTILCIKDTPYRFNQTHPISHLEQHFFRRPTTIYSKELKSSINIVEAANKRAEVENVAREIIKLCRDEDLRYNDISVVLRDLESYSNLISITFDDYNIPYFIDLKRPVIHHPLIELIRSSIEAVVFNFPYDSVFRYLKTDLVDISREEVDKLENYVLAHGIKGKRWIDGSPWDYVRKYTIKEEQDLSVKDKQELEAINKSKVKAIKELKSFYNEVKKKASIKDITQCLLELLLDLKVPEKLENWSKQEKENGRLDKAMEYSQLWDGVIDIFDQLVEALGEEEMDLEEYLEVLDTGLEGLKLGVVPLGLDQVTVGSLERSRNPDTKAVFIIGVSEGVLPLKPKDEGILNDRDRLLLKDAGMELAPDSRKKLFDERFYIYIALTRASQRIYFSYPVADSEGKKLIPSPVIKRLKEIYPKIKTKNTGINPDDISEPLDYIVHQQKTLSFMISQLRKEAQGEKIPDIWWKVFYWYASNDKLKDILYSKIKGFNHYNQEKNISENSMITSHKNIRSSVSRLEKYMKCPFSYFANYSLKLKERQQFKVTALDLGQFYHTALDKIGKKIKKENIDWGELSEGDIKKMIKEVVDELAPKIQSEILLSSARHRYIVRRIKKTLEKTMSIISYHSKCSKFKPLGYEMEFGKGKDIPPIIIELPDNTKIELVGKIDRVDIAENEDEAYVRIIDYKSGNADLKIEDIYNGLNLQLLVYLDVLLTNGHLILEKEIKPGGVLYFRIADPIISESGPLSQAEINKKILKEFKMKGLVIENQEVIKLMDENLPGNSEILPVGIKNNGDFSKFSSVANDEQFYILRKYFKKLINEIAIRIMKGHIEIKPIKKAGYTPCIYCSFSPVCQFDTLLYENKYQILKKEDEKTIWEKMQATLIEKEGEDCLK